MRVEIIAASQKAAMFESRDHACQPAGRNSKVGVVSDTPADAGTLHPWLAGVYFPGVHVKEISVIPI
jgi:hypothetical protein